MNRFGLPYPDDYQWCYIAPTSRMALTWRRRVGAHTGNINIFGSSFASAATAARAWDQ